MLNFENFLAFAKTQEGDVILMDIHNCAIAQFLKSQGCKKPSVGGWTYKVSPMSKDFDIPESIHEPLGKLMNRVRSNPVPWTEIVAQLEGQPDA